MTPGSVSVRVAELTDARSIAELTRQLGYDVPLATLEDRLARLLQRAEQRFMVAEMDGDVVGWVHVVTAEYIDTGVYAHIAGLVVEKAQRKKGIGQLLMSRAEAWARERGCSIVRLWSSAVRTKAHRFYKGLGYINIKTQYAFVKSLDPGADDAIRGIVPRIDR